MAESNEQRAGKIQALLRERRSCEVRGLKERIKLINQELRNLGHEAEKPVERAERRPSTRARAISR